MVINKTNLETQVQARIDGLTGTETLKDLLILSKAAEGLNVNRAALDTVIEAALGELDGTSEVKDLLVGNKSRPQSSGLPVNSVLPMNDQNTVLEINGGTYLRSGYYETDVTSYPDAKVTNVGLKKPDPSVMLYFNSTPEDNSFYDVEFRNGVYWVVTFMHTLEKFNSDGTYTGESFDLTAQGSDMVSITHDGTHLWVLDITQDRIHKYEENGTYTNTYINAGTQSPDPRFIAFDGTYIVVYDRSGDDIYRYDTSGTYVDSIQNVGDLRNMGHDGTNYWVMVGSEYKIKEMDNTGTFTGRTVNVRNYYNHYSSVNAITFDGENIAIMSGPGQVLKSSRDGGVNADARFISVAENPSDIVFDGTHYWVLSSTEDSILQYNSDYKPTGVKIFTGNEDAVPNGITFDGNYLWVTGRYTNSVYQYDRSTGYTGVSFSVASQIVQYFPAGITFDGTHIWVTELAKTTPHKYDTSGNFLETVNIDNTETVRVDRITWDGNYFWATYSNKVYKFDASWNLLEIITLEVAGMTGIEKVGNYFYLINSGGIGRYNDSFKYIPYGKYDVFGLNGSYMAAMEYVDGVCYAISTSEEIFKVYSDGFYTEIADVSSANLGNPKGIIWSGTNYFVLNVPSTSSANVVRLSSDWVEENSIDISSQALDAQDIAFDGTHIWVATYNKLHKYDANMTFLETIEIYSELGVYTNQVACESLTFDGKNLWVFLNNPQEATVAHIFDKDGKYTGVSSNFQGVIRSATWDGEAFMFRTLDENIAAAYTNKAVGMLNGAEDTDTNLPIYVRIK